MLLQVYDCILYITVSNANKKKNNNNYKSSNQRQSYGKYNGCTGKQKREAWGANIKVLCNESRHADISAVTSGVAAVVVLGANVLAWVTDGAGGVGGVGGGS